MNSLEWCKIAYCITLLVHYLGQLLESVNFKIDGITALGIEIPNVLIPKYKTGYPGVLSPYILLLGVQN